MKARYIDNKKRLRTFEEKGIGSHSDRKEGEICDRTLEWRLEEASMENYRISQHLKTLVELQSESEEYFDSIFNNSLGFEEVFDKTKDQKDKTFDAQGCFENNLQTTVQENNSEFTNHIFEMKKIIVKKQDQFEKDLTDYKYVLGNQLEETSEQHKTKHSSQLSVLQDSDVKYKANHLKHKDVAKLITVNTGTIEENVREVEESFREGLSSFSEEKSGVSGF